MWTFPLAIIQEEAVHYRMVRSAHATLAAFFLFVAPLIGNTPTSVSTVISEVTVYSDRALITRSATVDLQPGENILEIPGLPLALDDNSVRVNSQNAPGVKLESIEVRPVKPAARPVDTKRLEDQLQGLQDQLALLKQRLENNALRSRYLNILTDRVQNLISPEKDYKITPADLREFLELHGSEDMALREFRHNTELSIRAVEQQIKELREQLDDTKRGNPVTTKKVVIVLTAEQPVTAPIRVSYVMTGASWTPVYDLRSDLARNKVELRYYANVSQNTGEDWNNVMLTLSTARPNIGARMGELTPWRITTKPPPAVNEQGRPATDASTRAQSQVPTWSVRRRIDSEAETGGDVVQAEEIAADPAPLQPSQAKTEELGTAMVFRVPIAATIPSDSRPRRSTITITELDAKFRHITTPRLVPAVFIEAQLTNGREALLPGETNLFMGDDYLGKGRLNFVAANAPFTVLLGVDDAVKIKRDPTVSSEEVTGLLGKRREITRGFRVEATNFRKNPIDLIIRDQIPVSGEGDLNVRVDWNPRPARLADDTGIAEWNLALKPGEKATIEFRVRVDTSPANQVYGL